jgi:hypothetical protein
MAATLYDFAGYAAAVGYAIQEAPADAGYLPALGEHVAVHTPEGKWVGVGEVLRHDPTGPYVAVLINACTVVVHLADIQPAPWHGDAA